MIHKEYSVVGPTLLKLVTIIALTIAYLCSGCSVSKKIKSDNSDTTSVKKSAVVAQGNNTGAAVKTEDNKSHDENEWSRLILKYLPEKNDRDTTINNFITQPATIIYEKGTSRHDEEIKRVDSSWYHSMMNAIATATDSINHKIAHYEKTKRTSGGGFTWILLIIACAIGWTIGKGKQRIAREQ